MNRRNNEIPGSVLSLFVYSKSDYTLLFSKIVFHKALENGFVDKKKASECVEMLEETINEIGRTLKIDTVCSGEKIFVAKTF